MDKNAARRATRRAVGQRESHQRRAVGEKDTADILVAGHALDHRCGRTIDTLNRYSVGHGYAVAAENILAARRVNSVRHQHQITVTGSIDGILDVRRRRGPTGVRRNRIGTIRVNAMRRHGQSTGGNAKENGDGKKGNSHCLRGV